jgi:hypothetical protein
MTAEEYTDQAERKGFTQLSEGRSRNGGTILRESVWAMALALRYASKLGAKVGVQLGNHGSLLGDGR